MKHKFENNERQFIELLTANVFNCFEEKLDMPGHEFAKLLDQNFSVGCNSNDSLMIPYFNNVVVPHKIAVYEAGLELAANTHFSAIFPFTEMNHNIFIYNLKVHDLTKFSNIEAFGYSRYNFKDNCANSEMAIKNFAAAWHHHKMNNPHHPEYWLNPNRSGVIEPLPMPNIYILEMIADWMGAAKTYGGTLEEWLPKNISKFKFKNFAKVAEMITLFTGISVKIDSGNVLICE